MVVVAVGPSLTKVRTHSTTTRDRNPQFGAPSPLHLFEFSPVDVFPFSPGILCNLVRKSPQSVEKLARFPGGEKCTEFCHIPDCHGSVPYTKKCLDLWALVKNNGFRIPEFRNFGLLSWFWSRASRIFGAPDLGLSELQMSEFQISEFQISEFQISEFPDFGAPGFGAPKFGVPSFGIPQVRSSNFSTHEFDCSGGSGVGRHCKNSGFGIRESRSLAFPGFGVVCPDFRSS